jgi:hypothetical protein
MDAIARQPEASGKSNSYAYRSCIIELVLQRYSQ